MIQTNTAALTTEDELNSCAIYRMVTFPMSLNSHFKVKPIRRICRICRKLSYEYLYSILDLVTKTFEPRGLEVIL